MSAADTFDNTAHETLLLAALREAQDVLYDSKRRALAVIAILEKMDFADTVASNNSDEYDLVFGVKSILAQLRDDADAEVSKIESLARRVEAVQGGAQ